MPTVTVELGGASRTLTVPDAFLKPPRNERVAAIVQVLPHDTSFGSALQYGAHNALEGVGDPTLLKGVK